MSIKLVHTPGFIQDFIHITQEVFSMMASLDVRSTGVKKINGDIDSKQLTACLDVTGILGFSGGRKGFILISLPESLALMSAAGMLGMEFSEVDDLVTDGVGELVNMIAGGTKTKLEGMGVNCELSIPNTVVGRNHQVTAPPAIPKVHLEFATEAGDFFIEAYIKEE